MSRPASGGSSTPKKKSNDPLALSNVFRTPTSVPTRVSRGSGSAKATTGTPQKRAQRQPIAPAVRTDGVPQVRANRQPAPAKAAPKLSAGNTKNMPYTNTGTNYAQPKANASSKPTSKSSGSGPAPRDNSGNSVSVAKITPKATTEKRNVGTIGPVKKPAAKAPATSAPVSTPDASTPAAAPSKTLSDYINDAQADLGPGTDYSGLENQLQSDTANADSKVNSMYQALTLGIRNNDPVLKSIYDDAANQTQASGAQAQSTVSGAYGAAQDAVAARVAATGGTPDAVTAQWAGQDMANNQKTIATNQQTALDANTGYETNARVANNQRGIASQFTGAETRAQIAQGMSDSMAKLQNQQSTEDASRRQQALQYAISLQGNDQTNAYNNAKLQADATNDNFSQQLAMANYNLNATDKAAANKRADAAAKSKAAYNQLTAKEKAAYDAAQLTINQQNANTSSQNANTTASHLSTADALAAQRAKDANALALAKITASTKGQSNARKSAALAAAYRAKQITAQQYQAGINALG